MTGKQDARPIDALLEAVTHRPELDALVRELLSVYDAANELGSKLALPETHLSVFRFAQAMASAEAVLFGTDRLVAEESWSVPVLRARHEAEGDAAAIRRSEAEDDRQEFRDFGGCAD